MTERHLVPTLTGLSAACLLALATGCGDDTVEPPPPPTPVPTTVTISPASATLQSLGETALLTAEVRDQNGQAMANAAVAWTSSDPSVATVAASGLVTAVANGAATVTATAGSASGTATVTVDQVVAAVAVNPPADTLLAFGDTLRLSADALDANGNTVAGAEFVWASGDTLVAVVDQQGLVTGGTAGEVEVTATSADMTGRAQLAVLVPTPTTVAIEPDTVGLNALGQTVRLAAEVRDRAGRAMEGVAVSWSTGDTLVATVDATGLVTAAGNGTTTVAATADSVSGQAAVTVMQSAGSVVLSPTTDTIAPGDTLRLAASAFDGNGHVIDATEFDWSSSDVSVARVDESGLVTALSEGRTTVTAVAGDVRGTAEIRVENPDRAALVALYNATDGPNWVDNTNWLTDAPLGEWYGVSTGRSGRVVRIDLRGEWDWEAEQPIPHGLRGPIPPELGDLARLEILELGNNALWGPIPPQLGSLTNLRWLHLGGNNLEGRIPPELGRLANLEDLGLWFSGVEGPIPPELGELVNLRDLSLGWNALVGPIPPELASLTKLVSLDLAGNDLVGRIPAWIGNLANLAYLRLDRNDLSGPVPPELGLLNRLESLWLHGNPQLSGPFPKALVNLPLDAFTWACGTRAVCAPGTSEFVNWLDGIEWTFDGPFCNASDQGVLSNLFDATGGRQWTESAGWLGGPALEEWHGVRTDSSGSVTALDLSENGLSGGLPDDIAELTQLTRLRIDGNALSGRLPLSLTSLALDEFDYAGTELCVPADDSFQAWLDRIPSVKGTGTQCAPLTDRDRLVAVYEATGGPEWARDHNWLTRAPLGNWHGVEVDDRGRVVGLSLRGNGLSGVIPPEIAGLASLRSLRLSWGDLSGRIPEELGDLANLEHLDVTGNELEGTIPPELGRLSGLHTLSLGRNHLSGLIPEELGDLANLEHLDLGRNDLAGAIPSALGRLSGLRALFLPENDLSGPLPRALGRLGRLMWLDLAGNGLSGVTPQELGDLAKLESLELARNRLAGRIPPELGDLTNVRRLSLSENELSGAIPPELGSLTSLESIYLSENELSGPLPPQFGGLSRLRTLDLKGNPALSGALPASVTELRLESLQAGDTDLCMPREPAFETWLATVPTNWIALCGAPWPTSCRRCSREHIRFRLWPAEGPCCASSSRRPGRRTRRSLRFAPASTCRGRSGMWWTCRAPPAPSLPRSWKATSRSPPTPRFRAGSCGRVWRW